MKFKSPRYNSMSLSCNRIIFFDLLFLRVNNNTKRPSVFEVQKIQTLVSIYDK